MCWIAFITLQRWHWVSHLNVIDSPCWLNRTQIPWSGLGRMKILSPCSDSNLRTSALASLLHSLEPARWLCRILSIWNHSEDSWWLLLAQMPLTLSAAQTIKMLIHRTIKTRKRMIPIMRWPSIPIMRWPSLLNKFHWHRSLNRMNDCLLDSFLCNSDSRLSSHVWMEQCCHSDHKWNSINWLTSCTNLQC